MPFSPRGIEQSLVLPPRWPLILYTGTMDEMKKAAVVLHRLTCKINFNYVRDKHERNTSKGNPQLACWHYRL